MSVDDTFEKKQFLVKLKNFEADVLNFDMDNRTGTHTETNALEKAVEVLKFKLMETKEQKLIALTLSVLEEAKDTVAKHLIQEIWNELARAKDEGLGITSRAISLAVGLKAYCTAEGFEGCVDYWSFCDKIIGADDE